MTAVGPSVVLFAPKTLHLSGKAMLTPRTAYPPRLPISPERFDRKNAHKLHTDQNFTPVISHLWSVSLNFVAKASLVHSLELGTLRAVLLYYDLDAKWRAIRKKVKLQKARKLGRMLPQQLQWLMSA